ncbi:SUKH-4 family immunity protein [Nibribacter koreensis]
MNYKVLLKCWTSEELSKFDAGLLSKKGANDETTQFLSIVGLPKSAAPFLTFGHEEATLNLQSIHHVYETDEFAHEFLLIIGSEGAGNPFCIDLMNNGQVVVLDHEQELESTFVNTSVNELFQFLSAFKEFGKEVISLNGEDAFLDSNFTDEQYERLTLQLKSIDEKAVGEGNFWFYELENLLANREYFLKEK